MLFCLLLLPTLAGAEPVGSVGDPQALVFEGVTAFEPDELRGAVLGDTQVFMAAHPTAERAAYLKLVQERLLAGYRFMGFGEASVAVRVEGAKLRARVSEGKRFRTGIIRLKGAKAVKPALIETRLAAKEGAWAEGAWATMDAGAGARIARAVEAIYREEGYFFAEVEATVKVGKSESKIPTGPRRNEVSTSRPGKSAALQLRVKKEGPAGICGAITVKGAKASTAKSVRAASGLKKGERVDSARLQAAWTALRSTGRFRGLRVEPKPGKGSVGVEITVTELEGVPPLGKPLTLAQSTLLATQRWLSKLGEAGYDLSAKVVGELPGGFGEIRALLGPTQGVAVTARRGEDSLMAQLRPGKAGLYTPARRCEGTDIGGRVTLQVSLGLEDPSKPHPFTFQLGAGYSTLEGPTPVDLELNLEPGAFLLIAERHKATAKTEGGVTTVVLRPEGGETKAIMKVEAATGRLLSLEAGELTLKTVKGAFAEVDALAAKASSNTWKATRPLMSYVDFALGWTLGGVLEAEASPELRAALPALLRLLEEGVLSPAMDAVAEEDSKAKPFQLPPVTEAPTNPMEALVLGVLFFADQFFPYGSWPWTLLRQGALVVIGKGQYTGAELQRVAQSGQMGPVGRLAYATALGLIGSPARVPFAQLGLAGLGAEAFLKDVRVLMRGPSGAPKALRHAVATLRTLKAKEIQALAGLVEPGHRAFVGDLLRTLADPITKDEAAIEAALSKAWEAGLKAVVKEALEGQTQP